jgi:hypothetical protein
MNVAHRRFFGSVFGAGAGCLLGLLCWWQFDYGVGWALFIGATGAFIGFAFAMPGVSSKRVIGATAAWIIASNPCDILREPVFKSIAGNEDDTASPSNVGIKDAGSSWRGAGLWAAGLLGISSALLIAYSDHQKNHANTQGSTNQDSEEMLKKAAAALQQIQGLDPIVLRADVPKAGDSDNVEIYLKGKLKSLGLQPDPDVREMQRLQKSLEYWLQRKKKAQENDDLLQKSGS